MSADVFEWQGAAWRLSLAALARGAHALLLAGARGLGKRQLALALGAAYLCAARRGDDHACGACESCRWLEAGTHPDFALIEPLVDEDEPESRSGSAKRASAITVNQIRALRDLVSIAAHRDAGKVILIHPAEALNVSASNALLKNLEEPPAKTVFLLVAHRPALLLPTVRSRCQLIPVTNADANSAQAWLAAHTESPEPELLLALAGGAPLAAAAIGSDPAWSRRKGLLQALTERDADPVRIAEIYRDVAPALVLSWLQTWTFDLVHMRCCGRVRYHRDLESVAASVARSLNPVQATRLHRAFLALQRYVHHPLNPRLLLDHMLIAYRHGLDAAGS